MLDDIGYASTLRVARPPIDRRQRQDCREEPRARPAPTACGPLPVKIPRAAELSDLDVLRPIDAEQMEVVARKLFLSHVLVIKPGGLGEVQERDASQTSLLELKSTRPREPMHYLRHCYVALSKGANAPLCLRGATMLSIFEAANDSGLTSSASATCTLDARVQAPMYPVRRRLVQGRSLLDNIADEEVTIG